MLSVIIPTLNAAHHLPHILAQVQNVANECIVSDGISDDETLAIAISSNVRLAVGCKGRGWQLARGAKWARGEWLLFIHADTVLPDNWEHVVKTHIKAHPDKAAYFRYQQNAKGVWPKIVSLLVGVRCRVFALPYGDQTLLISRALYTEIGGYPDWDLFEDVHIVRALGRKRLCQLPAPILTSAVNYQNNGYIKTPIRNMILLVRFLLGTSPGKLKERYYK